jgi:DNA-binding Lrp family transcriptional regulator
VDDLDIDILRWMYPGGVMSMFGTDPRITSAEIARHVGLDRTAVWDRLQKWRQEGFWDGFEVHVNVRIFGVGLLGASIHVAGPAEGCALMERLEHVDGVLGVSLHFGDSRTARDVELVAVMMVADDAEHIARRMRTLRGLSPSGKVNGPDRFEPPRCSKELTPLDWRILSAIVAHPNAPVSHVARLVGVTLKTFTRHRSALLDEHVVTYGLRLDWSKLGCVALGAYCVDPEDVPRVQLEFSARRPHSIPVSLVGISGISADYDASRCFAVIVPAHSPHEVQTLVRDFSKIPGVRMVRPELWGPQRRVHDWISQRIAEQVAPSKTSAPGPAARTRNHKEHGPAGHATSVLVG